MSVSDSESNPPVADPPVAVGRARTQGGRRRRETVLDYVKKIPIPSGGFAKGALVALGMIVPLTAAAAYFLGKWHIAGDPEATFSRAFTFTCVFAGLPAILTGGGIGRRASLLVVRSDKPKRQSLLNGFPFGVLGAGALLLTVVPLGELPQNPADWATVLGIGFAGGLVAGFVLGMWISWGQTGQHIALLRKAFKKRQETLSSNL